MNSSHIELFDQLSEEFTERLRRGERPPVQDYVHRYPQLAADIVRLFPALAAIEQAGSEVSSLEVAPTWTAPTATAGETETPRQIGAYRIVREIGHGGMGVVYEAVQESLGRHVALKILPFRGALARKHLERFLRESKAAARLQHPHIVPIFDIGEDSGIHFYAMQFIAGAGVDELLAGRKAQGASAENQRWATEIGLQVAEALDYAHREGVVHRDIKPSNLLVDAHGCVWVADFGLAKAEGADDLTETGDIVGTLGYMAPERFNGWCDARSDVYALAATLYEMLTHQPAFADPSRARLIRKILHESPVPPRRICRDISRDLENIVLKGLAKEPGHRYPTAQALAEDLKRFRDGRPVLAQRATWTGQARRWVRRNPWLAGMSAAVAALLVFVAVGSSLMAMRLDEKHRSAVGARREAHNQLVNSLLREAQAGRWSSQANRRSDCLDALARAVPLARELDLAPERFRELRNEAIATMALTDLRPDPSWSLALPRNERSGLVFDHVFEHYAVIADGGIVTVHRWRDDRELVRLSGFRAVVHVDFSPDDRYLVIKDGPLLGQNGLTNVQIWDWQEPSRRLALSGQFRGSPFAFTPDSRHVLVGHDDQTVRAYALPGGAAQREFKLPFKPHLLRCHPDGRQLAVFKQGSAAVEIRDLVTGALRRPALTAPAAVMSVEWSGDGQLLATGCANWRVYVWRADSGERIAELVGHHAEVTNCCFHPDGMRLLTSGWDTTTRLWDIRSGQTLVHLNGTGPHFSPDGRRVALFGRHNYTASMYELVGGREFQTLHGHTDPKGPWHVSFGAGGRILASSGRDGVRLWDGHSGAALAVLPEPTMVCLFHPDGRSLLTAGQKGLSRWPLRFNAAGDHLHIGPVQRLTPALAGADQSADMSADGSTVAIADPVRQMVYVYRLGPGLHKLLEARMPGVSSVRVSPDGRWVVGGAWPSASVQVWDMRDGSLAHRLPVKTSGQFTFTPDGQWLIVSSSALARRWRVGDWEPGPALPDDPAGVNYNPTVDRAGRMIAIMRSTSRIQLLDADTSSELALLESPAPEAAHMMAFSPDGDRLAVACGTHVVQLWDLRLIRTQLAAMGLDWDQPAYPPPAEPAPLTVDVDLSAAPQPRSAREAELAVARYTLELLDNPLDAWTWYLRGRAQQAYLRKPELARADLSMAIALCPDLGDAYHYRAHALDELNRPIAAALDFTRALNEPGLAASARAHLLDARGMVLMQIGLYDGAAADFTNAVTLKPEDALILGHAAWYHAVAPPSKRHPARALPLAQRAAKLAPAQAGQQQRYHFALGAVEFRLGHDRAAIAALESSLQASRGRWDGFDLLFLAMSHQRAGEPDAARACLERATRWHDARPNLPHAWHNEWRRLLAEAQALLQPAED